MIKYNRSQENKAIIADIDGCLFDTLYLKKHLPKNYFDLEAWRKFQDLLVNSQPKINWLYADLLSDLAEKHSAHILFITSREATDTLITHTVNSVQDVFTGRGSNTIQFFFRNLNDCRPSHVVKEDILRSNILHRYDVVVASDDEAANIDMFIKYGIPTLLFNAGGVNA